jgi:ribonuclease P protein component
MRVRRSGKSYPHPLLILIIQEVNHPLSRFAVTAGISVGNAVKRNRAKRIIRAALRELIQDIKPGYNGILIARKPLTESNCREAKEALESLFRKAEILLTKNQ